MTLWDAMFLPDVLRARCRSASTPTSTCERAQAAAAADAPLAGRWLVSPARSPHILVAFALSRQAAPLALRLALCGVLLGGAGLVVYGTAMVALMTELRRNEVLLVCLPTTSCSSSCGGGRSGCTSSRASSGSPRWRSPSPPASSSADGAALAFVAGPLGVIAVRELQNARRAPATEEPFAG